MIRKKEEKGGKTGKIGEKNRSETEIPTGKLLGILYPGKEKVSVNLRKSVSKKFVLISENQCNQRLKIQKPRFHPKNLDLTKKQGGKQGDFGGNRGKKGGKRGIFGENRGKKKKRKTWKSFLIPV